MFDRLWDETNPLYYIVVISTALWVILLIIPAVVSDGSIVYIFNLTLFAVWAVLPVAMAFDVGILRQTHGVSTRISIILIVCSAVPLVAPLAGGIYVGYRSQVVSPRDS